MKKEEIEKEISEALDRQGGTLMGVQMILAIQTRMMAEEHEKKMEVYGRMDRFAEMLSDEVPTLLKELYQMKTKAEGTGTDEEHTVWKHIPPDPPHTESD